MRTPLVWLIGALLLLTASPSFALDLRAPSLPSKTTSPRLLSVGSGGDVAPALISPLTMKEFGVGLGAAAIVVPGGLALGSWLGSRSPNLYASALPPVLLFLALPPLAVTFAEWMMGRQQGDSLRWGPALAVGVGTQLLLTLGAFFFGVSTKDMGSAALFTLAEIVVLPSAITLTMHLTRPSVAPAIAPTPVAPAAASDRFSGMLVPLASAAF